MARILFLILVMAWLGPAGAALGQPASPQSEPERPAVAQRPKPDLGEMERLRFVTDTDYPPFNYLDENGTLTGFNVDLARAICDELGLECIVQPLGWEELVPALTANKADAAIASLKVDAETVSKVDFTESYYHTPARFVARKDDPIDTITPEAVQGRSIGVIEGTAHEAFLRDFFGQSRIRTYESADDAKDALRSGAVDILFGDGISLMFWLNGTTSNGCCEFRGGPYTESKYFGEGVGIAVKQGNRKMREILDYGLEQVRTSGRLEELLLRYFPMSVF